eukprot:8507309-Pyramimonas_sp.AAC.1
MVGIAKGGGFIPTYYPNSQSNSTMSLPGVTKASSSGDSLRRWEWGRYCSTSSTTPTDPKSRQMRLLSLQTDMYCRRNITTFIAATAARLFIRRGSFLVLSE